MRTSTSSLALAAFIGSTAMTGAGLALVTWFAVGQAVWLAMVGPPLMLLSAGVTVGSWPTRDERLPRNLQELRVMRLGGPPGLDGHIVIQRRNSHSPYSLTWPATRTRPYQRRVR